MESVEVITGHLSLVHFPLRSLGTLSRLRLAQPQGLGTSGPYSILKCEHTLDHLSPLILWLQGPKRSEMCCLLSRKGLCPHCFLRLELCSAVPPPSTRLPPTHPSQVVQMPLPPGSPAGQGCSCHTRGCSSSHHTMFTCSVSK